MFEDLAQWIGHAKRWWWAYLLGYAGITSLIGLVMRMLLRHGNRLWLTVMFYPAIVTWRLLRKLVRRA